MSEMKAWPQEPWIAGPFGDIWIGVTFAEGKWGETFPGSSIIVASPGSEVDKEAIRRRIIACVNACAGLSTEELEGGAKP